MRKFTEQFKLKVVKRYLSGRGGYKALGSEFDLDYSVVRRWVMGFKAHGVAALRSKKRVTWSANFKLSVLRRMWRSRLSYYETAVLFDIRSQATVVLWAQQYAREGIKALEPRRQGRRPQSMPKPPVSVPPAPIAELGSPSREQLLKENELLRAEVAYLKKLDALIQARKRSVQPKKRK